MADFRCLKCKGNLSVSHTAGTRAMKGLAECNCGAWTPFKVSSGFYEVPDESLVPVRECPKCGAKAAFRRRCEWPPDGDEITALDSCSACGLVICVKSSDREGHKVTDMYPRIIIEPPEELPESVKTAYKEALLCHGAHAPNGALLMCRRAVQEALNHLGAKEGNLPLQLQDLLDKHKITPDLKEWADHARIGGKLAAHGTGGKEWGDATKVTGTLDDADAVITFCNAFFEYVYVMPERNRKRRSVSGTELSPQLSSRPATGDNEH